MATEPIESVLMVDSSLTQVEADALLALEKRRLDDTKWIYPVHRAITIPLISTDRRKQFLLDLRRRRIDMAKGTYQNRVMRTVILARLDFGSHPHRNPDGQLVASPHLHLYREGYGDKWAFPVSPEHFPDVADLWRALHDFMRYCNITKPPLIEGGLFA